MIKLLYLKALNLYRNRGLSFLILALINFGLARVFGLSIGKSTSPKINRKARSIFKGRSLKRSNKGYFYVDPMPSLDQLDSYYSMVYWESRGEKNNGINLRDIVHYQLLKTNLHNFFPSSVKCILNFGAGHGGISHLFWLKGFDVINVEPSGLQNYYDERFQTYKSVYDVPDNSIDLIYGSHSLEHVQNIENFKEQVSRILKSDAILFWEVPNAKNSKNGSMNNRIDIPHTYYFFEEFFENWFDEVILIDSYNHSHVDGVIENWKSYQNKDGSVIRALGRIR